MEVCPQGLSIWRLFHLPIILMFKTVSHIAVLPVETLEKIFLHLPGQDMIKMESVRGGCVRLRAMGF